MTILVVEDNTILAKNISRSLQRSNYHVEIAQNLACARQFLSRSSASVLCLDLQLPDGNGLDLLDNPAIVNRNVPVIIMTGTGLEQDKLRAKQFGVAGFLIKPFALADLEQIISFALNRTDRLEFNHSHSNKGKEFRWSKIAQ